MSTIPRIVAAFAGVMLAAAACGDGGESEAAAGVASLEEVVTDDSADSADGADTDFTADEAALEFSACMREAGLDFPDIGVDADGNPDLREAFVSSGLVPGSDDFQRGMESCGEILQTAGFGGGGRATLADNPEITDAFVEFSDCVRDAGFDVGDLRLGGPGGQGGEPPADGQGQRGQGQGQGGFGAREEAIAGQLGLDYEDPDVAETIDACVPIIDTALANAGVGQPGGR